MVEDISITDLLNAWVKTNAERKRLTTLELSYENKIKAYLKQRLWNHYKDKESKISVTLGTECINEIDRKQLMIMLTPDQWARVTRLVTKETLTIITKDNKEKIRDYLKAR